MQDEKRRSKTNSAINKLDINKLDINKLDINKLDINRLDINRLDTAGFAGLEIVALVHIDEQVATDMALTDVLLSISCD